MYLTNMAIIINFRVFDARSFIHSFILTPHQPESMYSTADWTYCPLIYQLLCFVQHIIAVHLNVMYNSSFEHPGILATVLFLYFYSLDCRDSEFAAIKNASHCCLQTKMKMVDHSIGKRQKQNVHSLISLSIKSHSCPLTIWEPQIAYFTMRRRLIIIIIRKLCCECAHVLHYSLRRWFSFYGIR